MTKLIIALVVGGLLASAVVVVLDRDESESRAVPAPQLVDAANLVSDADVEAARKGSPERVLLRWAQAVQFSDDDAVVNLYVPSAMRDGVEAQVRKATVDIGAALGRPEVLRVDRLAADRVRIRGYLVSYDQERRPVLRQLITVYLRGGDSAWLLESPDLLLRTYEDRAEARRRSATPSSTPTE